jgi:hypothetical protein
MLKLLEESRHLQGKILGDDLTPSQTLAVRVMDRANSIASQSACWRSLCMMVDVTGGESK